MTFIEDKYHLPDHSISSVRNFEFVDKLLEAALEKGPALSVEELAIKLSSNHAIVHRYFQLLRKVPKLGKWVPHKLFENNLKS